MLFPTVTFALFFAVVLPASWWLMPRRGAWKAFMLAASYVFYGSWDYRFAVLLAASTVVNQLLAVAIDAEESSVTRRNLLGLAVAANIACLGFFKYFGFFVGSAAGLLAALGVDATPPALSVLLPVGISFFTFQALSYVIDVYRRVLPPAPLGDVAVYLAFFPHVVAGPIVRGSEFLPQLRRARDAHAVQASEAFALVLRGLFKKVVVASFLATTVVDPVFSAPGAHGGLEALVAVYAYAVQIYADFSGYTDMAIGLALLLGFRFPVNFDRPYGAASLQEFWQRWHITLSRWLRDYLYIPLGGSRGPRAATSVNLFVTMLLGGLWHGASWTFVAWGALHGVGLVAGRALRDRRGARTPAPLGRIVTFHVVCLGWVLFRADSFATAWQLLGRLAGGWTSAPLVTPLVLAVVGVAVAVQQVAPDAFVRLREGFARLAPAGQAAALAAALVVVEVMKPGGVVPFIYFRF